MEGGGGRAYVLAAARASTRLHQRAGPGRRRAPLLAALASLVALAVVVVLLPAAEAGHDGYTWIGPTIPGVSGSAFYQFESGGSPLAAPNQGSTFGGYRSVPVPSGFSWEFYGTTFATGQNAFVGEGGLIGINQAWTGESYPQLNSWPSVPNAGQPNGFLAPFFTNLRWTCTAYSGGGPPSWTSNYQTGGVHPRWIISYNSIPIQPNGANAVCDQFNTFQTKMFQGTDIVEYHYQRVDSYWTAGANFCWGHMVGMENQAGNQAVVRSFATSASGSACNARFNVVNQGLRIWWNDPVDAQSQVETCVPQGASNIPVALATSDDPLYYYDRTGPTRGTLMGYPTGNAMQRTLYAPTTVLYTPNPAGSPADWPGFGTDAFTYSVTDGHDGRQFATVTLHVNAPPVAADDFFTVDAESSDNVFAVLDNDSDPFGSYQDGVWADVAELRIIAVAGATQGTPTIAPDGLSITYTPTPGAVGQDTFTYTISDGCPDSTSTATVNVDIVSDEEPPTLTSISPAIGAMVGGTAVTLTGSDFQVGAAVTFGGDPATVTGVTPTQITATTPPAPGGLPGLVDVTVTNPDEDPVTLANGFRYVDLPEVQWFAASAAGPSAINIDWDIATDGVDLDSIEVHRGPSGFSISPDTLQFTLSSPPLVGSQLDSGLVSETEYCYHLRITDAVGNQVDTAAQECAITDPPGPLPPPTVTAVTPDKGPPGGGTPVTITGSGFVAGATVTFDGVAATGVTVQDDTQITATTPAGSGSVTVAVNNPDEDPVTLANGFRFVAAPVINPYTASGVDHESILLEWTVVTDAVDITSLQIWRSTGPTFAPPGTFLSPGPGLQDTDHLDMGLGAAQDFCYRLVVADEVGNWAAAVQCAATLAPPIAFVAVGEGGTILTSEDSVSWQPRDSGTNVLLRGVAHDGETWVAVGQQGTLLTSPDAITWTPQDSDTDQFIRSAAHNGTHWIAVGDAGTLLASQDAVTWAPRESGVSGLILLDVHARGDLWVVAGEAGTLLTSVDGEVWTPRDAGTNQFLRGLAFDGERWVLVGTGGVVRTSDDNGLTWQTPTSGTPQELRQVAWDGARFVTVGLGATLRTSLDGANWADGSGGAALGATLNSVAGDAVNWVVVGGGGQIFTSPADPLGWAGQSTGAPQLWAVAARTPLPDLLASTLTASPTTLHFSGVSTSTTTTSIITVQLRYADGTPVPTSVYPVCLAASMGSLSDGAADPGECDFAPLPVGDGAYTATFTSPVTQAGSATITATLRGAPLDDTAVLTIIAPPAPPPPVLDPIADRDVTAGMHIQIPVRATQGTGDPIVLRAEVPAGAVFTDQGAGQGILSWPTQPGDAGLHPGVRFSAEVAGFPENAHTRDITITVRSGNPPPPSGGGVECAECPPAAGAGSGSGTAGTGGGGAPSGGADAAGSGPPPGDGDCPALADDEEAPDECPQEEPLVDTGGAQEVLDTHETAMDEDGFEIDSAPTVAPIQAQPGRFAEPKTVGVAPMLWLLLTLAGVVLLRRRA